MASLKPIKVGDSKRLSTLWGGKKKSIIGQPTKANSREDKPGYFNQKSLTHSSKVLGVDPTKKYS